MLKQLTDKYWSWKRRRAEKTINDAYRRTAPKGQPPSSDITINNYYAAMREKPQKQTPSQAAAERVRQQTLARAGDPPRKADFVEERSDHHGAGNIGHFDRPTVRVKGMLPPMKGKDE